MVTPKRKLNYIPDDVIESIRNNTDIVALEVPQVNWVSFCGQPVIDPYYVPSKKVFTGGISIIKSHDWIKNNGRLHVFTVIAKKDVLVRYARSRDVNPKLIAKINTYGLIKSKPGLHRYTEFRKKEVIKIIDRGSYKI